MKTMLDVLVKYTIFSVFVSVLLLTINKVIKYEHKNKVILIVINICISILQLMRLGEQPYGLLKLGLSIILVNIAFIDLEYMEIPDTYNLVILILGISNVFILQNYSLLISGAISFVFFFIIAVFSGGALGGGDIKLSLGLGLFFTPSDYPMFLIYTFGLGALIAIVLLITKKRNKKDKIPFAPFMSLGAILSILL